MTGKTKTRTKTRAKRSTKATAESRERKASFAVASQIKKHVREKGYFASSDLSDAVSQLINRTLDEAIARAEQNGRRTVRSHDL